MKKLFYTIDIVYKPISKIAQTIDYYFSNSMRNAYRKPVAKVREELRTQLLSNAMAVTSSLSKKKKLKKHLEI